MRSRRSLHRALQQQAVEGSGNRIGAMLQIDLELAGAGLLHHRVDGETLHLANPIDVIDERRKRVHLLKPKGKRPARIAGEAFRRVQRECAIGGPARNIELELDRRDRRLAGAGQSLDLIDEHAARIELLLGVDDHHDLCVPTVADGDLDQRLRQKVAVVVPVAGFPEAAGLLNAIAERVHDENRGRHHEAALGDADEIGPAYALAARNAVHIEQESVDPLYPGVRVEKGLRFVDGEPRRHDAATPLAAAPNRWNSDAEMGSDFTFHSGCHCTPRQNAASSGPRAASTSPSSAKASGFSPSARRAMPCECSEFTINLSSPTQSRNLPRRETICTGPYISSSGSSCRGRWSLCPFTS